LTNPMYQESLNYLSAKIRYSDYTLDKVTPELFGAYMTKD